MKGQMAEVVVISPEEAAYPKDRLVTWFPTLPALHALGNLDLLRLPLTALFCSRKCPGDAILKAYDLARELRENETPVISGFHAPVEKDMLEILLKGKGPIVICPARGLEGMRITGALKQPIDQGRVLILSCFQPEIARITQTMAKQRNQLVLSLAFQVNIIYASLGGEVEKLFQSRALNNSALPRKQHTPQI